MAGPARWERGASRLIASTPVLDLRGVQYRHPVRGSDREFTVVSAPDWVNVVALTADGRVVLVRQFRYGTDAFSLEIPGGVIEAGEDPRAAAARELAEETGYAGGEPRLLGSVHPNPAIQDNRCHFALIEGAERRGEPSWDRDEEISVETAPVEQVLEWARSGRITHGLVHCALFRLEAWLAARSV